MISKVAVIGLGSIGRRHVNNLRSLFPTACLLSMSASGRIVKEGLEGVDEVVASLSQLIDHKPDFVIVASPASLHANHSIPLIEAGIPVLIEKPVTASVADAKALLEAVASHNTPVAVGYCLRYMPSAIEVKRLLDEGVIGPIYNVHSTFGQYLPDWRADDYRRSVSVSPSLGGGVLLEVSHELDYLQWLLGDLTLQYAQLRTSCELDLDVEELADIVLTSAAGSVCNIHLDFLQKHSQRNCSFIGAKGRLEWGLKNNTVTLYSEGECRILYSDSEWDKNLMYLSMINDFVSIIDKDEYRCIDVNQASKVVTLVDEIKKHAIWGVKQ